MKIEYIHIFILSVMALVASGCSGAVATTSQAKDNAQPQVTVPTFNPDSAYSYVAQQVAMGYRIPGSESHKKTAEWLVAELQRHKATVIRQEAVVEAYDGTKLPMCNIIAQYAPEKSNRILLAAHWDSRPYADHDTDVNNHRTPIEGANDGASGVGVLLEVARHLGEQAPAVGVDIILFDAEDYGAPSWSLEQADDSWALGSRYWAEHPHIEGYRARYAILLDMVGAKGVCFYREYFSDCYASHIVDKVWQCAANKGYSHLFVNDQGGAITDDHLNIMRLGIPAIDIIQMDPSTETGFFAQWHTLDDNMQQIDPHTLSVVGEVVMTIIYEEK